MISRDILLKPLQLIAGVVERRQTLPILANVLLRLKDNTLELVGTDLEVELLGRINVEHSVTSGAITVPARKFMDICRSLPEEAEIELSVEGSKLYVRSGKSRFNLTTLPANQFPNTEEVSAETEFSVPQQDLCQLIEATQFAMAQQDVRYYLNGMLWEVRRDSLRTVTTDGHRLAYSITDIRAQTDNIQVIVPRKAVMELGRLLSEAESEVTVTLGRNHLRVKTVDYVFTSKLIDGRFPDYEKVIPQVLEKCLVVDRDILKQALSRVAILVSEKHRSVRLELKTNLLKVATNNPDDQEKAEEEVAVGYMGPEMEIAFNINYLIDALNALPGGEVKLSMAGSDSSVRIEGLNEDTSIYVVMPMRL